MTTRVHTDDLPGSMLLAPPWGQEEVLCHPDLRRRIQPVAAASQELCVVIGAGGAFGPDLIHALLLRGTGVVLGVDVQLTYPVWGAVYRYLDLHDASHVHAFFHDLRVWCRARHVHLGTVYDISTVQTSPVLEASHDRSAHLLGKQALCDSLRAGTTGDVRLFYMSSAEVYGVPEGAPYTEDHTKQPFNVYGRMKWQEEQDIMSQHGKLTTNGRLLITCLRPDTIAMVNYDANGAITGARNYNDPILQVLERLAKAHVRIPLVNSHIQCDFHQTEAVAHVCLLLGNAPVDSHVWGRSFNMCGKAATHGEMRDITFDVFSQTTEPRPWWSLPARLLFFHGRLPKLLFLAAGYLLEAVGGLGARDAAGRVPFFYRSNHMNSTALRTVLKEMGVEEFEEGTSTTAVQRLATGFKVLPHHSILHRRYAMY